MNNLEKYKLDLKKLIDIGDKLTSAIKVECFPDSIRKQLVNAKMKKEDIDAFFNELPSFKTSYQHWYSEALVVIKLFLPDRINDFRKIYERPKARKAITYDSYSIEDYLQSLRRTINGEEIVGTHAAIDLFQQQLSILKSVERRFESSLFDIEQLAQADLFDSEIEGAKELLKNKFIRAAGVIAGVVLEKHLGQVCKNHSVFPTKKNPTINDFNEQLKNNSIIDTPTWRSIGLFADIRNNCGHGKGAEPSNDQVQTLIDGVDKLMKTLF